MKIKEGQEEGYRQFCETNSHDGYSYGVVKYMHWWADLMEEHIKNGEALPMFAEKTSHEADKEGITGFMYGCAVGALSQFWEYGEELRKWHNGEWGYNGDGVVNPAILTVKRKEGK